MPITIKSTELKYKNPSTGQYQGIDAVAETTTSQQCALIEAKGAETIASIPSDYTTLSDTVDDLNGAINDIKEHFKWVSFGNTSAVTTQIDAFNGMGAYFGRVEYAAATGLPEATSGVIYANCYNANYKRVYYYPIASADKLYYIEKKGGTWQSWVQLPTKSDIDSIQSSITSLTTATTPETITLTAGEDVTLNNVKAFKIGKLAVISFNLVNANSIASNTTIVSGLPAPSSLTWGNALNSTPAIHPLYIISSGQMRPSGALPAGDWTVNMTYIADNT